MGVMLSRPAIEQVKYERKGIILLTMVLYMGALYWTKNDFI